MIARLLGAVQFLTVLPVRRATAPPGESAVFFPLVGAVVGALMGAADGALSLVLPRPLAAALAVGVGVLLTGGLHEDGLADTCDALRAGRTREKMLAIMKDSRIGTYGAVAVALSLLVRWQALAALPADNTFLSLAVVLALSRAVMVALAYVLPAVGEGLGTQFARVLTPPVVALVGLQAALALVAAGAGSAGRLLIGLALAGGFAAWWFWRRLGGVTGDCLGAAGQMVEVACLTTLAARASS